MDADDEPMEVEYESAVASVTENNLAGLSDSDTEMNYDLIPAMFSYPEGYGMKITAVTSGESAKQLADIAPESFENITDDEDEDVQEQTEVAQVQADNKPKDDRDDVIAIEDDREDPLELAEPIAETTIYDECKPEVNPPTPSNDPRSPGTYSITDDEDDVVEEVEEVALDDNDEILSYPKGSIKVEDYKSLDHRQMMNGNIIDYWMHNIYHEQLTEEQRKQTHFYDSNFFTTLAVDSNFKGWNEGENQGLSAIEKRYNRVKDLPCNQVNIFEKDFIVIPCLEKEHWFLAIVCYPRLNGARTLEGEPVPLRDTFSCKPDDQRYERLPIRQSCILIFDSSLDINGRGVGAIMKISNFLKMTHLKEYKDDFEFDSSTLFGSINEVPQQSNALDCGLFVLEFIESFFKNPPKDFRAPMRLGNWFERGKLQQKRAAISRDIIQKSFDKLGVHPRLPPVALFLK